MKIKNLILTALHSILILAVLVLIVRSVRYIFSFYSTPDHLGDKAISLLYFLIGLAICISLISLPVFKASDIKSSSAKKLLKMGEFQIPLFSIALNLFFTFLNISEL